MDPLLLDCRRSRPYLCELLSRGKGNSDVRGEGETGLPVLSNDLRGAEDDMIRQVVFPVYEGKTCGALRSIVIHSPS